MADDGRIVVYLLVLIGAGCFFFIKGFFARREKRLIENTPTSKVRSLAMGRVEVCGKVMPFQENIFKTPFSDLDCVYCKWTVEEYRKQGKNSKWVIIRHGELMENFYITDDTGKVLVDPDNAQLEIDRDVEFSPATLSLKGKSFLESQSVSVRGFLGIGKRIRMREYYLLPKDELYIMGTAGDNPFVVDGSSQKNENDIMIKKGRKNSFFYISDKPEKEILKKYTWKIFGGLYGGSAMILTGLALLFAYFDIL